MVELLNMRYWRGRNILAKRWTLANSCGRAARGDDMGMERLAVLCSIFLSIVYPRARFLDEEDWTSKMTFWRRLLTYGSGW